MGLILACTGPIASCLCSFLSTLQKLVLDLLHVALGTSPTVKTVLQGDTAEEVGLLCLQRPVHRATIALEEQKITVSTCVPKDTSVH